MEDNTPAMKVKNVHFSYGKNKILNGVSFQIEERKITTIMGGKWMWQINTIFPDDEESVSGKRQYLFKRKEYIEF